MLEGDSLISVLNALANAGFKQVGTIAYKPGTRGFVFKRGRVHARVDCGDFMGVFTNLQFSTKPFNVILK